MSKKNMDSPALSRIVPVMGYTKLFSSIITSTIWSEDDRTRIVWITMLALADKNGEVQGSVPGLARMACVPVEDCRASLQKLMSPDPDSRTKDDEGRRIEEIDGGWSIINFLKYRELASREETRASESLRKARYRDRKMKAKCPGHVPDTSGQETFSSYTQKQTQTQTQNPSESVYSTATPPVSLHESEIWAANHPSYNLTRRAVAIWHHSRTAANWTVSRGGQTITIDGSNWKSDLAASTWAIREAARLERLEGKPRKQPPAATQEPLR